MKAPLHMQIADFLRLQDTLERARQAVRRLMRVVAKGDQVKRAQRCEMTAFTQARPSRHM